MSERLYDYIEIKNLKEMLNKTRNIYAKKTAYKIRTQDNQYKTITHEEVRDMVDCLGTALIDLGLKGKRIAVIGQNRYEWEIAYLSVVCGTGIVVPLDKSLPSNELESLIERSEVEAIFYTNKYEEVYKVKTDDEIYKVLSNKIKEINQTMPQYKAIRGVLITEKELIKTTTNKIKRQANLDAIEKSNN